MAELEQAFEAKAREAFAEEIHDAVIDDPGNLAFEFRQMVVENFRDYARRNDYDLDGVIDDVRVLDAERRADGVSVTIGTDDGLIGLFEFGVAPHTIEGNPLLHFYWEEADTWIQTESVEWGSETGGIPEARAFRDAMHKWRAQVQARGPGGRFR